MEASAIVAAPNMWELAQKVMDWSVTLEANDLYQQTYAIVGPSGGRPTSLRAIQTAVEEALIDNGFSAGWLPIVNASSRNGPAAYEAKAAAAQLNDRLTWSNVPAADGTHSAAGTSLQRTKSDRRRDDNRNDPEKG